MNIVRTDTLFGSKKNIVGSTSSDLVLETLGKVYIKTGRSTKTLTEILSEYSKNATTEIQGNINQELIAAVLSDEYISGLINKILLKNQIFGEFVTIDSIKNKGNENLPIYFNTSGIPETITGLDVTNNIHTEAEVIGETGVSTKGISDISMYGGYDVTPRVLEILSNYTFTNSSYLDETLLLEYLSNYKLIQTVIELNYETTNNSIPYITGWTQNRNGELTIITNSIPIANNEHVGLLDYRDLIIGGIKTFISTIHAASSIDFNITGYTEPLTLTSNKFTIGSNNQNIPIDVYSSTSHFFGDVYAERGMSAKGLTDLSISGSYQNSTGFSGLLYFVGDVRGQGNTEANITITIEDEAVTNNKIKYPFIQLAGQSISLGTNISQSDLQDLLGVRSLITSAMKIEGTTTTDIITDNTTSTVVISGENKTAYNGMVIFYQNKEFVWVDSAWKELGDESSFMLKGSGVTNIDVSGDNLRYSKDGSTYTSLTISYATKALKDNNGLLIDTNYLKLTGGTLSKSGSNTPLIIKGGLYNYNYASIEFVQSNGGTSLGFIGCRNVSNVKSPYYYDSDFRTIWHSGNSNKSDVDWNCYRLYTNGYTKMIGDNGAAWFYPGLESGEGLRIEPSTQNGSSSAQNGITLLLNGRVGIGTVVPRVKLDVNGDICAVGGVAAGGIVDLTIFYPYS